MCTCACRGQKTGLDVVLHVLHLLFYFFETVSHCPGTRQVGQSGYPAIYKDLLNFASHL